MEQRLANTWRMTVNEKMFIQTALSSGHRVDGRNLNDYRELTINLGGNDGSSEVHLGATHVIGLVTAQLVKPYQDRPNEGSLSIYTEFSPMADPSFEPGRPGEFAVELGHIIDRSLRESRAVDMESLCILTGKWVWSIRVDLHILDNCGNLIDAANIAALAALLTFRRPECTLGGSEGQEVTLHPPEVSEPLTPIIHHLPVAVTFAFFCNDDIVVVDPTHLEEALMEGRMTVTINTSGDVCAIQKPGQVGIMHSKVIQCLRIASAMVADVANKIETAVELYITERELCKTKRHSADGLVDVSTPDLATIATKRQSADQVGEALIPIEKLSLGDCSVSQRRSDLESKGTLSEGGRGKSKSIAGAPWSWDPYSKGVDSDTLKTSLATRGRLAATKEPSEKYLSHASSRKPLGENSSPLLLPLKDEFSKVEPNTIISLKDAVKPKSMRRKEKKKKNSLLSVST